jgi:hypothetical protein
LQHSRSAVGTVASGLLFTLESMAGLRDGEFTMARERDEEKGKQAIGGQQSHRSEYGTQGDQTLKDDGTGGRAATAQTRSGAGSEPPRSMGIRRGTEFGQMKDYDRSGQQARSGTGQADLGSQAGSTLDGRTDQQDLGLDQPGRAPGSTGRQGEGFIAQKNEPAEDESNSVENGS